ncbi:MAG TPA: hypothetical protein DCZ01_10915 [Elusimicrobia bacterium]|nr:MAG: hypothetical protein A2X40_11865 [Elusimicrobia bacterium GWC2_65_9]HAZ09003.1 hypothetical protein [Elusimicrobiota bacterium]
MSLRVERTVLAEVVASVFKGMVGIEARPGGDSPEFLPIAAMIGISGGEDRMAVILRLSEALALKVAGAMLGEEAMSWGPAAEDAVAELANVIAGNLKPHLRAGMALSLPTVVHGSDFAIHSPRLAISQSETFTCPDEPLIVILARES